MNLDKCSVLEEGMCLEEFQGAVSIVASHADTLRPRRAFLPDKCL